MKRSAAPLKRGQFGPAKTSSSTLGTYELNLMIFVIMYKSISISEYNINHFLLLYFKHDVIHTHLN